MDGKLASVIDLTTAPPPERDVAAEAFRALAYNQDLIQFADSKAGTLILINSLFVATAQTLTDGHPVVLFLRGAYVLAASAAVVCCLFVVMSRASGPHPLRRPPPDLVFFGDICQRRTAGHYAVDFKSRDAERFVDDLLRRTYALAQIAQRKFRGYAVAQVATVVSGAAWLVANLAALVTS